MAEKQFPALAMQTILTYHRQCKPTDPKCIAPVSGQWQSPYPRSEVAEPADIHFRSDNPHQPTRCPVRSHSCTICQAFHIDPVSHTHIFGSPANYRPSSPWVDFGDSPTMYWVWKCPFRELQQQFEFKNRFFESLQTVKKKFFRSLQKKIHN